MTKFGLVIVAVATLLCGTAISNAQDRERPHPVVSQIEGMHRAGPHNVDVDRVHRRRPVVIIVGMPILAGPTYDSYYVAPMEVYRTIDGFYYYCAEPAGYYPSVQDCPNGWRLVP